MRERERDIEKPDPKGASCEFLLFCWSPQGTSLGDATHLTFAGKTSDGDYLLIIHYSYASCSKLSRYAQGDKALVTFSLLAVSTSSPIPPNHFPNIISDQSLYCLQARGMSYIIPLLIPARPDCPVSFTVRTSYRSLLYLYSCVQKGTLDPVLCTAN